MGERKGQGSGKRGTGLRGTAKAAAREASVVPAATRPAGARTEIARGATPALPAPVTPAGVRREEDRQLELAIGRELRGFRQQLNMTVVEVAKQAGLSAGMVSKIERGVTPPSLSTLNALARALNVPFTALFRRYEEQRDASYVRAGQGLVTERRGTRAGHRYVLLGHTVHKRVSLEPYLIELVAKSDVFPVFQHGGVEFIHMLEGEVAYRHGSSVYRLAPGDSLLFDADVAHGPEELLRLPIRFLSVMCDAAGEP